MVTVRVQVVSHFLAEDSIPEENDFVFTYHVRIVNNSETGVRLLRRYWLIEDGSGENTEVEGEGVVGETPYIAPHTEYKYTSFVRLHAPVGQMSGHYWMETDEGEEVKVPIPVFSLKAARWVH